MTCKKDWVRRAIAFAGALIITFNIVASPQRARAVAVTASVVASVAAIMTACGVSYWAASQTDAIGYLGGKIEAYLGSLETVPQSYEDWLGIDAASQLFEVTASGTMRFASGVANKILDFVRSFNKTEGVVSDGAAVGNLGKGISYSAEYGYSLFPVTGSYTISQESGDSLRFDFVNFGTTDTGRGVPLNITLRFPVAFNASTSLRVEVVSGGNSTPKLKWGCWNDGFWTATEYVTNGGYLNVGIRDGSADTPYYLQFYGMDSQTASIVMRFSNAGTDEMSTPATAVVTPSSAVAIPENIADDDSFAVTPNVALTQGMTVDQASEAVLGGVASEDGLTSEGETSEGAAAGWGWLADLLERIREVVQGTQEQTAPAQYEAIDSYSLDLTSFFPFCIPWDIHRGLSLLVAEPVAPSINWTVPLPDGSTYTLALDLSDWDGVAQVARTMELLAFVVALAVATKKLIKW